MERLHRSSILFMECLHRSSILFMERLHRSWKRIYYICSKTRL